MLNKLLKNSLLAVGIIYTTVVFSVPSSDKNVDAKCYVKLVGKKHTISFWEIQSKNLNSLASKIVGQSISAHSVGKNKAIIDKVYECVLLHDQFSTAQAKSLDKKTPR